MAENHLHDGSSAGLPPPADFDELGSSSVVEDAPPSPNGSSNAGGGGTGGGSNSGKKLARPIIRSAQACEFSETCPISLKLFPLNRIAPTRLAMPFAQDTLRTRS